MPNITVMYLLNEEGRKKSLLSGGDGKHVQVIETPVTEELLNLASVDKNGNAVVKIGYRGKGDDWSDSDRVAISTKIEDDSFRRHKNEEPKIVDVRKQIEFDNIQTVESLLIFERDRVKKYEKSLEENQELLKSLIIDFKKEQEEKERKLKEERIKQEEKRLQEEKINQENKLKKQAEKQAEKQEDIEWIKSKGSEYLNQCISLGYNCQRKYIEERVSKEFEGFEVDFNDTANWNTRVSPSQEALDEVTKWIDKGFNAKIVWLTAPIRRDKNDYGYCLDFEECEAVTIKFKGYDLIKVM